MTIPYVTVYNADGEAETHSRLNAVDLVRNNGYTYKPGRQYSPVESAPYAQHAAPSTPEPAHAVLAAVGSGSAIGAMEAAPVAFNAPTAAVTTAAPAEIFDAGKEVETPVIATESKPAVRRGRPSKAQLEAEAAAAAGDE